MYTNLPEVSQMKQENFILPVILNKSNFFDILSLQNGKVRTCCEFYLQLTVGLLGTTVGWTDSNLFYSACKWGSKNMLLLSYHWSSTWSHSFTLTACNKSWCLADKHVSNWLSTHRLSGVSSLLPQRLGHNWFFGPLWESEIECKERGCWEAV